MPRLALRAPVSRPTKTKTKTRRPRLVVESLEDRAVPAVTWQVQSDYRGTQDSVSQPRSLRGLALSADDTSIYGGFIQGTSSAAIRKVSSGLIASPITVGSSDIQAVVSTSSQAKGVATDDRGYVYATRNPFGASGSLQFRIYSSNLATVLGTGTSTYASSQLGGISVQKLGAQYYLYLARNGGQATVERWNVTNPAAPTLDTSWGNSGRIDLATLSGSSSAYCNGLEAGADGTLYIAGGILGSTRGDSVFKVSADGTTLLLRANVSGAMDVALFGGKVYVTQYLSSASAVTVLRQLDLSFVEVLATGIAHPYAADTDNGYSGVDVSASGRLYVADQVYNVLTPNRTHYDRILLSSQLDITGPVTSSVVAAPNPATGGPSTVVTLTATITDPDTDPVTATDTSTVAGAEYSVDGGVTWFPMAATDSAFDEESEAVSASFTLAALGLAAPGDYEVRVRGTDTAGNTGAAVAITLTVANNAPTAVAGGPYSTIEGGSVGLDGSNSSDPDQPSNTLVYEWDFDGDNVFGEASTAHGSETGAQPTFVVADLDGSPTAQYTVKLRVTDQANFSDTASAVINIANLEPTAALSNGGAVDEGSTGSVSVSAQTDPSAADNSAGFHYAYDFDNDGTFDSGNGTYAGSGTAATATVPASYLDDNPSRTVRARIIDKDDGYTDCTTTITINNVKPTAALSNDGPIDEGSTGTVSFGSQFDPSGTDTTAGFRYAYDFDNDGMFEVGDGTYAGSGTAASATVPASYLADGPGSRVVKARILDKDGGFTDYHTTIVIDNVKPTAVLGNGGAVDEGSAGCVSFSGQADPSAADAAALHYAYDFDNDGTFEVGDGTYLGSGTADSATVPASFLDDGPGSRLVKARVIDKDGGFNDYTTTITIKTVKPTATLSNGGTVNEGSTGSVSFASQFDPSTADTTAGFHYAYDFDDDGTFDSGDGTYLGSGTADGAAVPASFLDDGPGSRTVKGRIIDKDGSYTDYTTTIAIDNVKPTAALGNGGPVNEGSAGSVSFSGQSDPSATDTSAGFHYAYDFNSDGTFEVGNGTYAGSGTAASATVPASYLADGPGSRVVKGRVIDKDGGFNDYTTTIAIDNVKPTAVLGNGGAVDEGTTGSVSFSGQFDPSAADLAVLHYAYDFNNDGTFDSGNGTYAGSGTAATATVPSSFLVDGPGSRVVKGRVIDKDGGFTDYTTTITITNVKPTAALSNGGAVNEGSTGSVSFSGQADPSGPDTTAGFRYSYDFNNDGTFEVGNGTYAGSGTAATATVPASFLADGPGSRTVRARIIDKDGGFNDYTTTITINNVKPTAALSNGGAVNEGSAGSVSFSGQSDPSAADLAVLHYAYDFNNDGTFDSGNGTYAGSGTAASATVPASYLADGPGSRVVKGRVIDKDGGFTDYTTTITITNVKPTAALSNGGAVNEGSTGSVSFSGQADPSGPDTTAGFRYSYDFNNDGTFEVGNGTYAGGVTAASATVPASFLKDGPGSRVVKARIIDKDGGFTDFTTTITINNVKPTVAAIAGPAAAAPGQTLSFSASFTDPGVLDTHTAAFAWGDATPNTAGAVSETNGSGSVSASHTYTTPGTYTVTLTVTDKDGGATAVTRQVTVGAVGLQTDPCDPALTALVVGGTTGNDTIKFSAGNSSNEVKVTLNGTVLGTFSPTGHIIAYGQAGDDTVQVSSGVNREAWLFGGAGNDNMQGAGLPSVLVGGDGNDTLSGVSGQDVLIGGNGSDKLTGNSGDDILVAGRTSFDDDPTALCKISDEWTSSASYNTRVAHLKGTAGGLNGTYYLTPGVTVFDDGAADDLNGSGGDDWFLANVSGTGVLDNLKDRKNGEVADDL